MENLNIYENGKDIYKEVFGKDPDLGNVIADTVKSPEKIVRYVHEKKMYEMQGVAKYAAQFVDMINSIPAKERPYLIVGVEVALKSINDIEKANHDIIYKKTTELREESKACLKTVGSVIRNAE